MINLEKTKIDEFKQQFHGKVLLPEDSNYEEVRQIWNAMIDRKPGMIARCKSSDDVVKAVNLARENELLVSVRGGGITLQVMRSVMMV